MIRLNSTDTNASRQNQPNQNNAQPNPNIAQVSNNETILSLQGNPRNNISTFIYNYLFVPICLYNAIY